MNEISIIVPARNAERTISQCLGSFSQNIPPGKFEIILVDNGSSDGTIATAKRFLPTVISSSDKYVSGVRNRGASEAKFEILAFVDSDCYIEEEWYPAILGVIHDETIGVVGCTHRLPDSPNWIEAAWYVSHAKSNSKLISETSYVPAGNLILRSAVFEKVGGFDESLETGEDPDLCKRIAESGQRIIEHLDMRCVHLGNPNSLAAVIKREFWHGKGLRFRYSNGRLAPIAIATVLFFLSLLIAVGSLAAGQFSIRWVSLCALMVLAIPLVYAAKYAGTKKRPFLFLQLFAIYFAYFLGRALSLPIALSKFTNTRN